MIFQIVESTINDLAEIGRLLSMLYVELGEEADSLKYLTPAFLEEMLKSSRTKVYGAKTMDGQMLGIFTLTESTAFYAGGRYGILDEMFVVAEYRSSGIGEAFIQMIKEIGLQRGWSRIDVTAPTEERWVRTKSFYQKNGFIFTGSKFKLELF